MTKLMLIFAILLTSVANAQNTNIQQHEATERQKEADRNERANTAEALKPNEKYKPTQVDVGSWGIDPNAYIEITNHLLGYSTILENDQTLTGIKITGLVNLAWYNITKKSETQGRSKSRLVFGGEFPVYDITKRSLAWSGFGLTLGDVKSLYFDLGLEYRLANWFKIQGGVNYNMGVGINPQISLGLVW